MGTVVSKTFNENPDLKRRILRNLDFFNPLFEELSKHELNGQAITLNYGLPESSYSIELKSPDKAILTFRYPLDSDQNPKNGRVYLEDHFEFNPQDTSLQNASRKILSYNRVYVIGSGNSFWRHLAIRLSEKDDSSKADPNLQKFFTEVVSSIEIPVPEKKKQAPDEKVVLPKSLSFMKTKFDPTSKGNFGNRGEAYLPHYSSLRKLSDYEENNLELHPIQIAEDAFLTAITDPSGFLPFLVGSTFFKLGKSLSLMGFFKTGFKIGATAEFASAVLGVGLETFAFEGCARLQSKQEGEWSESYFRTLASLGTFRASNVMFSKMARSMEVAGFHPFGQSSASVLMHAGSWSVMHGVNELERSYSLRPNEGDYLTRILLDTGFYLHASASSSVIETMMGPGLHVFVIPEPQRRIIRGTPTIIDRIIPPAPIFTLMLAPEIRYFLRSIDGRLEVAGMRNAESEWHLGEYIKLSKDDHDRLMIQDLRYSPSFVPSGSTGDNPRRNPLKINSNTVNGGEIIYLRKGALITFAGNNYHFLVQEPGYFEKEFYAQPLAFQTEWWRKISNANSFDAVGSLLEQINIPGAGQEKVELESCLRGQRKLDSLSPLIKGKVIGLMERENNAMALHLPRNFSSLLEQGHPAYSGVSAEQRFHVFQAALRFQEEIQNAKTPEQIVSAARVLPFDYLENISRQNLLGLFERYQRGDAKLSEMPRDFGIRQKLADMEEFKFYRQHQEGDLRPSYGQDASFERNCADLDTAKSDMLTRIKSIAPVKGSAKKYSYQELADIIQEVLERGKPLEMIPTEKSVRSRVKDHMQRVMDVAARLFSQEWRTSHDRNYFTGENFGNASNPEQYLQTRYRFARMLLNEQRGLPIFGEPTEREKGTLVWFVKDKLKARGDIHFADAQWAIRDHLQKFTPQIQEGLRGANQEERALVMETFFGSQQHRMMTDPYKAFELARFLGEVGFYREVGVTLEIVGGKIFTNLSLGDLGSVHPEKSHQFFVLHTHPEEYLNQNGQHMGGIADQGRTIALDVGDASKDTRNVLFSHQDVRLFVRHASEIFSVAAKSPSLDLSIFYNRQTRVFKNWVQHPHGMAEMRVHLSPTGVAQKVEIQYGVKPEAQRNLKHISQANALRSMTSELHIPVEVDEVNINGLEGQLPYAGR